MGRQAFFKTSDGEQDRQYQIQFLQDRQREILRRISLGQENKQIARELGVTPVAVSYVRNSKLGREQLEHLNGMCDEEVMEINKRIELMLPNVLTELETILHDGNTSAAIRAKVGFGLLDRGGHAPVTKTQNVHAHAHLSLDDILAIKQRAQQAREHNSSNNNQPAVYPRATVEQTGGMLDIDLEDVEGLG